MKIKLWQLLLLLGAGAVLLYIYITQPAILNRTRSLSLPSAPPQPPAATEKVVITNNFDQTRLARTSQELDAAILQALESAGLREWQHRITIDANPTAITQRFVDGQMTKGGWSVQAADGVIDVHVYLNPQYQFANGIAGLVDRSYALALMQAARQADQSAAAPGSSSLVDLINYLNRHNIAYIEAL